MTNKWNFQKPTEEENRISKELADKLAISPVICQLLVKRGITTEKEANKLQNAKRTKVLPKNKKYSTKWLRGKKGVF